MRANIARFNRIAAAVVCVIPAAVLAADGLAMPKQPSLVLVSSASEAPPEGAVTIVLAGTNLPEGATITLTPPLRGELWVAAPDCESASRSNSLVAHATINALLCLTSKKRQSVRAIATVPLADHILVARSEPVKFYEEHWWSSPTFVAVLTTLLGAAAGIFGTLFTQRADHSQKMKDAATALENDQASFVVKLLLPELARHEAILTANNQMQAANYKDVQSLPRTNLVAIIGSERAKNLKIYFSERENQTILSTLTDYCQAADEYNSTVQGVKRDTQLLDALTALGTDLLEKLKALGISA
jgi:hypothetical protein